MQPQVFRHPHKLLAGLRLVALSGVMVCQPVLSATVVIPSLAYVLAASLLSVLQIRRRSFSPAIFGAAVIMDVIWFTSAVLQVEPGHSLPIVLFVGALASMTAGVSPGLALAASLLAAAVHYGMSVVCHGAQLGPAQRQLLGLETAIIALAGTLSGYLAGQIVRLRQTRTMVERLGRLNAAAAEMTAASSDAELVRGALTHAADIIGADRLWIMLADHEEHVLRLDGHIGASPSPLTPTAYPEHDGLAGSIVRTGASVTLDGTPGGRESLTPLEAEFAGEHLLAVPISENGSVGGVLLISRTGDPPFCDADRALLTMLGRFVARALHTARLIRRLHTAASTDSLTGLYNHETFLRKLEEQIRRAAEMGSPVSLIVLDMDGFKRVNDTAGHWAGDRVLKALAGTLRRVCRPADIIGRYGGDEFAVVLPATGREEAAIVAHRAAQALRTVGEDLDLSVPVTASWGVAAFPLDGANDEQVFRRADARLYEAKEAGGDRVAFDSAVA